MLERDQARVRVILIAAVSEDGFISRETGVPWDLPEDRRHFRVMTAGKCLLLGRRTYEEMLGWFKDHQPLVLTNRELASGPGIAVGDLNEAVQTAERLGFTELWVCGGASVYALAEPKADELVLTMVAQRLGGGVAFPQINVTKWGIVKREKPSENTLEEPKFEWLWFFKCKLKA